MKPNLTTNETTVLSKVPELTLAFWIIKILATTLGETGGDAVSMSMNLGYLIGTAIFGTIFIAAVVFQIMSPRFHLVIRPDHRPTICYLVVFTRSSSQR
jgi:uncharacterized membrane-anchored protein